MLSTFANHLWFLNYFRDLFFSFCFLMSVLPVFAFYRLSVIYFHFLGPFVYSHSSAFYLKFFTFAQNLHSFSATIFFLLRLLFFLSEINCSSFIFFQISIRFNHWHKFNIKITTNNHFFSKFIPHVIIVIWVFIIF